MKRNRARRKVSAAVDETLRREEDRILDRARRLLRLEAQAGVRRPFFNDLQEGPK